MQTKINSMSHFITMASSVSSSAVPQPLPFSPHGPPRLFHSKDIELFWQLLDYEDRPLANRATAASTPKTYCSRMCTSSPGSMTKEQNWLGHRKERALHSTTPGPSPPESCIDRLNKKENICIVAFKNEDMTRALAYL